MKQSNSYLYFKERTQDIFNFAVLVTSSVPILKRNLNLFTANKINRLPDPDFFEPSVIYEIKPETIAALRENGISEVKLNAISEIVGIPMNNSEFKRTVISKIGEEDYKKNRNCLKRQSEKYANNLYNCTNDYQSKLATYLYFSTFSYFEAYVIDITKEVYSQFDRVDKENYFLKSIDNSELGDRIKLNNEFDPRKNDRYSKYSEKLRLKGYTPPDELFFTSILEAFETKTDELKANEIPDFLFKTFHYIMPESDKQKFQGIRANRNSVGHGNNNFKPNLSNVIEVNKFFKRISKEIDKHIVLHFLKLNNYQK